MIRTEGKNNNQEVFIMSVKQISVFLETTTDGLMQFSKVLQENNIDIRAFSIAEAPDFSIARVIVDDFESTKEALGKAGYVTSVATVLAVGIPDRAGGLYEVLNSFTDAGVNVKYTYAFTGREKGMAYRAFRVDDEAKAIAALQQNDFLIIHQEDLQCSDEKGCL